MWKVDVSTSEYKRKNVKKLIKFQPPRVFKIYKTIKLKRKFHKINIPNNFYRTVKLHLQMQ